jgi:hypothetical protein
MDTMHERPDDVFGCLFKGFLLLVLFNVIVIFGLGALFAMLFGGYFS